MNSKKFHIKKKNSKFNSYFFFVVSYVNIPHTPCDNFTCKGEENETHGQFCKINVTELITLKNITNDLIVGPIVISWNNLHDVISITPGIFFFIIFNLYLFLFHIFIYFFLFFFLSFFFIFIFIFFF